MPTMWLLYDLLPVVGVLTLPSIVWYLSPAMVQPALQHIPSVKLGTHHIVSKLNFIQSFDCQMKDLSAFISSVHLFFYLQVNPKKLMEETHRYSI